MLNLARLANVAGYLMLVLGLAFANMRLAFDLGPAGALLGRAGFYLAAFSAAIFILGLLVLSLGWLAREPRSSREAMSTTSAN